MAWARWILHSQFTYRLFSLLIIKWVSLVFWFSSMTGRSSLKVFSCHFLRDFKHAYINQCFVMITCDVSEATIHSWYASSLFSFPWAWNHVPALIVANTPVYVMTCPGCSEAITWWSWGQRMNRFCASGYFNSRVKTNKDCCCYHPIFHAPDK